MFRNSKIGPIIIIAFLFVAITGSVFGVAYFYLTSSKIIEQNIFNHLETTAQSRAEHVNTYLEQNIERLRLITSKTWLRQNLKDYNENPSEEIQNIITEIITDAQESIKEFERICIIGLDGKIISSTDNSFCGKNISNKDFFINGKERGAIYFVEEDGIQKVFVSGPFILDKELLGVGITVVSTDVLKSIIKNRTGLGETGEVLVTVQGEDERTYLFERLFEEEAISQNIESEATAEPMKQALLGNEVLFENTLDYRDEEVIAVSQYIEVGRIGLVAKIDRAEALGVIMSVLVRTSLIIIVIITIIVGIIGLFVARSIIKPIHTLQKGIKIIEKGNLEHRVAIDSKNEIGQLSQAFDEMTIAIKKSRTNIEEKIKNKTADLEKLNSLMVGRELKMIELKKEINKLNNLPTGRQE